MRGDNDDGEAKFRQTCTDGNPNAAGNATSADDYTRLG